jgi:replicative DNA helicase
MGNYNRELTLADIPLPGTELLERQVIADAVNDPDTIGEVAGFVFPEYFSSDGRRFIWNTIIGMFNAREPIDITSVWHRAGKAYVEEIATQNITPAVRLGFIDHARLLQIANTKKRAYYAALTILQQSASPQASEDDIFAAAETLSQKIKASGQPVGESSLEAVLSDVAEEIEADEVAAKSGKSIQIGTGIPTLTRILDGGWWKGDLIILAARPSVGKTALMLQFAKTAARNGKPVLLFSLEMTKSRLGRRLILSTGRITKQEMRGSNVNWNKFEEAQGEINDLPISINDEVRTAQGIVSRMALAVNRGECEMAMIDHLNMHQLDSGNSSVSHKIGLITHEYKAAAKRLGIPIILLVQLNRDSAKEKRPPELYDLRESGDIEQDADVVIMLDQRWDAGMDKEAGDTPYLDIWIRKNREGVKNVKIPTKPNDTYTVFTEIASAEDYPQPPPEKPTPAPMPPPPTQQTFESEDEDFDNPDLPF